MPEEAGINSTLYILYTYHRFYLVRVLYRNMSFILYTLYFILILLLPVPDIAGMNCLLPSVYFILYPLYLHYFLLVQEKSRGARGGDAANGEGGEAEEWREHGRKGEHEHLK